MSKTITLLYFASIRSSLPNQPTSEILTLPSSPSPFPLTSLKEFLYNHYDQNEELKLALGKSNWSVNEVMIGKEEEVDLFLVGGEVVCGIPPVSGG